MAPRINGYLAASRRRALAVLGDSPDGRTEAIMLAHGFTAELLIELVRADRATASTERVGRGRKPVEVVRMKITEAGRRALRMTPNRTDRHVDYLEIYEGGRAFDHRQDHCNMAPR